MNIQITEFHLPDGRQTIEEGEINDDCESQYKLLDKLNCRITIEILTTGDVSICIEHEEGDYDCRICKNGPEVRQTVEAMLYKFTEGKFNNWLNIIESL